MQLESPEHILMSEWEFRCAARGQIHATIYYFPPLRIALTQLPIQAGPEGAERTDCLESEEIPQRLNCESYYKE